MILDYLSDGLNPQGRSDVWQEYQPRVGSASEIDQFSKALVYRDKNSALRSREFQQRPVAGIRP